MTVRNSTFANTGIPFGTAPAAGVDLEPDAVTQRLINVSFVNCTARGNRGAGIAMDLAYLNSQSTISVSFTNCTINGGADAPSAVAPTDPFNSSIEWESSGWYLSNFENGLRGAVTIRRCHTKATWDWGLHACYLQPGSVRLLVEDSSFVAVARRRQLAQPEPIVGALPGLLPLNYTWPTAPLALLGTGKYKRSGGLIFKGLSVADRYQRPWLDTSAATSDGVTGEVWVHNPNGCTTRGGNSSMSVLVHCLHGAYTGGRKSKTRAPQTISKLDESTEPPPWYVPRYHNSPPCLRGQDAPHDIAAALTTPDGVHHVWQFCTRKDNGNCTSPQACPFGRQWTHSYSSDYVSWEHEQNAETIGVYSGFAVVDERGNVCAGQRCPNSVLKGNNNGLWNCPHLQINGGGLNGTMADGTDVPMWVSCADPATMQWKNHSYLFNPHYYRQVAYDPSAWYEDGEWHVMVATDACNASKQHPCPDGFRFDLWTAVGSLRSSNYTYRGPAFSTNYTTVDGTRPRGEAITPSFSCGLPGAPASRCLLTNNGPLSYWLGRMENYRFVDSHGKQNFNGTIEQGAVDSGDTFGMPRVLADTKAVRGPVTPAGRRVMIGSIGGGLPTKNAAGAAQSLPRDLSIALDGGLRQRFVPELHALRVGAPLVGPNQGYLQMELVASFALSGIDDGSLISLVSGHVVISASAATKTWSVAADAKMDSRSRSRVFTAPLPMDASKTVWIHAYLDGTFLEVNANNATMISMALQLPNASATRVDALAATPLSLQTYKLQK